MKRELIIIGCFLNTEYKKDILRKTIDVLKPHFDIMLVSHYPIDVDIQQSVNYTVYDYHNEFKKSNGFVWYGDERLYYELHYNNTNITYAVYTSIKNGVYLAKSVGYDYFFYMEGDILISKDDIHKIKNISNNTRKENKDGYFFQETIHDDGKFTFSTLLFYYNIELFLKSVPDFYNYDDMERYCSQKSIPFLLEQCAYHWFANRNIIITNEFIYKLLNNSKLDRTRVFDDNKPNEISIKLNNEDTDVFSIKLFKTEDKNGIYLLFERIIYTTHIDNIKIYINNDEFLHIHHNMNEREFIYKKLNLYDVYNILVKFDNTTVKEICVLKEDILNSKDYIKFK